MQPRALGAKVELPDHQHAGLGARSHFAVNQTGLGCCRQAQVARAAIQLAAQVAAGAARLDQVCACGLKVSADSRVIDWFAAAWWGWTFARGGRRRVSIRWFSAGVAGRHFNPRRIGRLGDEQ